MRAHGQFAAIVLALTTVAGPAFPQNRAAKPRAVYATHVSCEEKRQTTWMLDAAQVQEFSSRLRKLTGPLGFQDIEAGKGYVQVTVKPAKTGMIQVITIHNGRLTREIGKVGMALSDPDQALETWLLTTINSTANSLDFTAQEAELNCPHF